jgi:hypothetical protein
MGRSFDANGRAVCGGCGRTGGGTRTRTCTFKVTTSASHGGGRITLPYCPAPVLCSDCFATAGKGKGLHAGCEAGAKASQATYDAEQAKLDAGDKLVACAWGDWDDETPKGLVRVLFQGLGGTREEVFMAPENYLRSAFTLNEYRELGVLVEA